MIKMVVDVSFYRNGIGGYHKRYALQSEDVNESINKAIELFNKEREDKDFVERITSFTPLEIRGRMYDILDRYNNDQEEFVFTEDDAESVINSIHYTRLLEGMIKEG